MSLEFFPAAVPALTDECDGVRAFTDLANDVTANFLLVDGFFSPQHAPWTTSARTDSSLVQPIYGSTGNVWTPWTTNIGSVTLVLPTPCVAVLATLHMTLLAADNANTHLGVALTFAGSGYRGPALSQADTWQRALSVRNAKFVGDRHVLLLANELVPGQSLTASILLFLDSSVGGAKLGPGWIELLAFTGEP